MQQRVAIARALAYQPSILLMDEPFASVDAQTRGDLEDLVLRVREEFGMTILFVTHDIDESVYLADRVVVLTHSPTEVKEIVPVDLPPPRDQIATKELPEFAHLRAHVYRLIKREQAVPRLDRRRLNSRSDTHEEDRDERRITKSAGSRLHRRSVAAAAVAAVLSVATAASAADGAGQRDDHRGHAADRERLAARPRDPEGLLRRAGDRDQEDDAAERQRHRARAREQQRRHRLRRLGAGDDRAHAGDPVHRVAASEVEGTSVDDNWQNILVKGSSSIRTPADLAGKTIAVNALKGVGEVMIKAALKKVGVDPNSVKLLALPFPAMRSALNNGQVDAIWAPEPFVTQALTSTAPGS